jgi:hypothetical protein
MQEERHVGHGLNPRLDNMLVGVELTARVACGVEAFRQIAGRLLGLSIVHREDSAIERQLIRRCGAH